MNTFGERFRLTDFGETHGTGIGGVVDGCPAGLPLDVAFVQRELDRRSLTQYDTESTGQDNTRREPDTVRLVSGLYEGMTTGAPIAFFIDNKDVKIVEENNNVLKPSHASFVLKEKFGHHCNEQGGRFSARQTACRVVGGAIAKLFLQQYHIDIKAVAKEIASADSHNTAGAIVECVASHVPAGLGEPTYGGLDARLAAAMLSIPACKGFEVGEGFEAARMTGSQYNDLQTEGYAFRTNHDGGIQAGISNGQNIRFRLAFKPIPSLPIDQPSLDFQGNPTLYKGHLRNDKSVVPRVLPVVEAMAALVLADAILLHNPNLKSETCSKHLF